MNADIVRRLVDIERRLDNLETQDNTVYGIVSDANVTTPSPTDAELDSAFDTPANLGAGFMALVDDAGAGTDVFVVASDGTNWHFIKLTLAT